MAYERINRPKGLLYHYTKKSNLESILKDGRIRRFQDRECWFCTSLDDTFRLMELTVMQEESCTTMYMVSPVFTPSLCRKIMWC